VAFDQSLYAINLGSAKATAVLQPHRVGPELGRIVVTLDVDVRRFVRVASVKEEPVRPLPENGRHSSCSNQPALKETTRSGPERFTAVRA
jgi:hypothetical protein